uniref:B30.2/SPRY domain-containing protein n=1 Tax=Pygocentrus nattereri TaxID=42514 RepID=A0A3B4E6X1_PYGNA
SNHCLSTLHYTKSPWARLCPLVGYRTIRPCGGKEASVKTNININFFILLWFYLDFCQLTLDPNTAHRRLILSEKNRALVLSNEDQDYPDHPERFDYFGQVLSAESLSGRCYWEVEYSGVAAMAVSYKDIRRKGDFSDGEFGYNDVSWRLFCSSGATVWHYCYRTEFPQAPLARIGVYVDHRAGILSFYSVSDTMTLLHTIHSTFTQPLYHNCLQLFIYLFIWPVRLCLWAFSRTGSSAPFSCSA